MSNENNGQCSCQGGPKLIFPCSGAADLGAIVDQAGRMLMREGDGKMFCLSGIGGRVRNHYRVDQTGLQNSRYRWV